MYDCGYGFKYEHFSILLFSLLDPVKSGDACKTAPVVSFCKASKKTNHSSFDLYLNYFIQLSHS